MTLAGWPKGRELGGDRIVVDPLVQLLTQITPAKTNRVAHDFNILRPEFIGNRHRIQQDTGADRERI